MDIKRTSISYNHLNLPAKVSQNGSDLAKYSYLADGSKSKAEDGSGVGLVYRGSLIYRKASDRSLTLEGASMPEGRLTVNGVRWYVKDHLGSVRAVVDGSTGGILAVTDYEAYGEDTANATASSYLSPAPAGETFRDRFTGKEDQGSDFGTAYTDFGARQYSPALRRWLVPDPLSEKYYGMSPYAYCAGNPVNLVDADGKKWLNTRLIAFLKEQTNARIKSLEQSEKTENNNEQNERIMFLRQSLSDIELLENDTEHYYALTYNWGEKNQVRMGAGGIILIDTYSDGISLHEIRHVAQSLLAGGLEFNREGFLKNAALNQGADNKKGIQLFEAIALQEIEAYKVQFSMDGVIPISGINTLKGINIESVGSITNDKGEFVYPAIKMLSDYNKKINSLKNEL